MPITKEQAVPGTTVMYGEHKCTILQGGYEDAELGFMVKTSRFPGGMPLDKYSLSNTQQLTIVDNEPQTQTIVFKGKIVGELEETIFTPELIAERSKPLLALKIKGVFDSKGAEEVKKAINKAVKMRTAVEGIEEPIIKNINSQAKKAVAAVREVSKPIYEACYATQNTLQATYDAWVLEVQKAEKKAAEEELAKTVERENKMYELGMTFNGQAFVGYGKAITKNSLYSLDDDSFKGIVTEIEGLNIEQDVTGEVKEAPIPPMSVASMTDEQHRNFINNGGYAKSTQLPPSTPIPQPKRFENQVYTCSAGDYSFHLTKGVVNSVTNQVIINERVMESAIYVQVVYNGI